MSPVHLTDLGFQRNQPEEREGLSRTRRPERGHLGHSSGWQNNEGDNIQPCHSHSNSIETSNQRTGKTWIKFFSSTNSSRTYSNGAWTTRGLTWHLTGQNLEKEVQTPGGKGTEDKRESSHYPSNRRT
ncbi:hypothetical protein O181_128019, partial [Austropuccinia psidii MF-1]|nr:hypothetical protein [Austropuccinia psidii MF-1]